MSAASSAFELAENTRKRDLIRLATLMLPEFSSLAGSAPIDDRLLPGD